MSTIQDFHDVRFPVDLAFGAAGGPVRKTEVVTMASGKEQRNTRWANSRRRYNVGYGIKTSADLYRVIEFFEERRGRLYGFRFRDPLDWKSGSPDVVITSQDQQIGVGNGQDTNYPLVKSYGLPATSYVRAIRKPVESSILVSLDGNPVLESDFVFDANTGCISFTENSVPQAGALIACGYEFDIPVRFDADEISVNLSHFQAGDIPSIPLVEVLL